MNQYGLTKVRARIHTLPLGQEAGTTSLMSLSSKGPYDQFPPLSSKGRIVLANQPIAAYLGIWIKSSFAPVPLYDLRIEPPCPPFSSPGSLVPHDFYLVW